ncbi:hypothetical protein KC19_VG040700 [Ceratodon purpureus]|uniref:Uncharacterized protein n=1 Tax=Ceratodon purpureus TaxID=3225 RepID=A0A8T0HLS1_CERPU|nr:hypothetical protein KC19_VG040700 [Ceratodon purpureus]
MEAMAEAICPKEEDRRNEEHVQLLSCLAASCYAQGSRSCRKQLFFMSVMQKRILNPKSKGSGFCRPTRGSQTPPRATASLEQPPPPTPQDPFTPTLQDPPLPVTPSFLVRRVGAPSPSRAHSLSLPPELLRRWRPPKVSGFGGRVSRPWRLLQHCFFEALFSEGFKR